MDILFDASSNQPEAAAAGAAGSYQHILTETRGKVGLITLNRPKALNALCNDLFTEVNEALRGYDADSNIGAIVITGSEKAFAGNVFNVMFCQDHTLSMLFYIFFSTIAGADIKEMKSNKFIETYKTDFLGHWAKMTEIRKPIIAAVNGYAVSSSKLLQVEKFLLTHGI